MMKKILYILFINFFSVFLVAQNVTDAVRWSYTNPGGTARTLGVGGSFGAMGGDYSSVNINPAGLGAYRMSEFTISPSLTHTKANAALLGTNNFAVKNRYNSFSLDNAALVLSSKKTSGSSFAIGFSKIADLNKYFSYTGKSPGSITQRFEERANGKTIDELDEFEAYPAYNTGAIFDLDSNKFYDTDFTNFDEPEKSQIVEQSGFIQEFSISYAKNMNEKFFFGASLGVPFVSYEETKQYNERDSENNIPTFNSLNYTEYLNTSGAGINLKAGFIYSPMKALRIGGAIHTPTYYYLNDDYYTNLKYSYMEQSKSVTNEYRSADGSFRYRLNTPTKVVGSIGSIFNIGEFKGFINGDIEWIDYNTNKFNFTYASNDPSEQQYTIEVNNEIKKYLGSVLNIRVGTELAYGVLRLRGGMERGQDPVSANDKLISTTSLGIGVREDNFFIDLGYRTRNFIEGYVPYVLVDPAKETVVNVENTQNRIVLTIGFKF
jgi:hypothetical protein